MNRYRLDRSEVRRIGHLAALTIVTRIARDVEPAAKRIVAGGTYGTGRTAQSIGTTYRTRGTRLVVASVGSDRHNALVIHSGAGAHEIQARGSGQLRFFWRKAGRVVTFSSVHHPGMTGKRYLTRPLALYGPRHGARVVIYPH